jgi:hypothetical protein
VQFLKSRARSFHYQRRPRRFLAALGSGRRGPKLLTLEIKPLRSVGELRDRT